MVDPRSLANSALWLKVLGGDDRPARAGPKGENVHGKMPNDTTTLTAAETEDPQGLDLRRREVGLQRLFPDSCGLRRMSGVVEGNSTKSHISHSRL